MENDILFHFSNISFEELSVVAGQLAILLSQDQGARIGQSTVISCKMHYYRLHNPEEAYILQKYDAGRIFYNRKDTGKIFHADVFHQCGLVDPKMLAQSMRQGICVYNELSRKMEQTMDCANHARIDPDLIDIQTAGGGGRITGALDYGKKTALCKAHENHVHIAGMAPGNMTGLFYIIQAAENAILESGLELRCNEKIFHVNKGGGR